jgi:aspartyl-tRNA(Asn)/glutamyl-tRNA(Gln) amidotransferase subunit B
VQGGTVEIVVDARKKTVHLTRAHLEEDAGKSLHEDYHGMTGIDLNRAGTPLLEIVTEPQLRSSAEAVAYAKALHSLVVWLGICDGNMQEGSFRCDANVSVRPAGRKELGTRCEIKNLNSFKFLQAAIDYEVRRQIELIEDGGKVVQATRLYDPDRDETREMRTKEDAMDYRYFPDPDLLPLAIDAEWVDRVRASLPELPEAMRARLMRDYGLSEYDARTLTASRALADYYEAVASEVTDKKLAANWVMGEVSAALNASGREIDRCPIVPGHLAGILTRLLDGRINAKGAKDVFARLWKTGEEGEFDIGGGFPLELTVTGKVSVNAEGFQSAVDAVIGALGVEQISDTGAIEALIDEVLAANAKMVEEFRAGKEKAFNALVGQAMRATRGKANPAQVNEILRRKLAG